MAPSRCTVNPNMQYSDNKHKNNVDDKDHPLQYKSEHRSSQSCPYYHSEQQQCLHSSSGDRGERLKLSRLPHVGILLKACLLFAWVYQASASGRLVEPTMRSSVWRFDPDAPVNYNDQGLNCGGLQIQYGVNAGLCGVCGDPYSGPRENEDGGLYSTGGVVRRYRSGSRVTMVADLVVPKGGYFEVKLCPRDQLTTVVTQECFDAFSLKIRNGRGRRLQVGDRARQDSGLYKLEVQLPPGVTCTHCVIQWRYLTAPTGATGGASGLREEFRNCADVTIGYYGDQEASPGQPDDLTRGLLSEKIQTYIFSTGVDPMVVNREKNNYRFASKGDFTNGGGGGGSSEEDDEDRRFRPGRFSEWPQRLPSGRPGQESGFGYATLLLGSQGRGDQAFGSIRENLNRNNRQKLSQRQRSRGGSSSDESDESNESDDDDDERATFPRRLPGLEQNINEVQIPAINENYDRHNGGIGNPGMGYGDQYNPGAGDYSNGLDGYSDGYGGQDGVGDNTGLDYGDPFGTGTGDYTTDGGDGTLYGDNYDGQDGINNNNGLDLTDQWGTDSGDYTAGLDGSLPGVSLDPFAGLFGGNIAGQSFVVEGDKILEPSSPPSTYFPLGRDQNPFMNTADPSNPFVAFFNRDRATSEFQDTVDSYPGGKPSGMSYADLRDRISSRQPFGPANDAEAYRPTALPLQSRPPATSGSEFYSDTIDPGYDDRASFRDFPDEPVSDYPTRDTPSSRQTERELNPPGSLLNPQRIINGIKNALERLVNPRGARRPGVLDVQADLLRDRVARLVAPPTTSSEPPRREVATLTRPTTDRRPDVLPGMVSLPDLMSERIFPSPENMHQLHQLALQRQEQLLGGLDRSRQGFNLNLSLSSDSHYLPGLMSGPESIPTFDSPHPHGSLSPLGPIPPQGPLNPMASFPTLDGSLPLGSSHPSGLPPPPSLQNPNPTAFHWLPHSAHDMSAMGDNFHFLNAHAANQYLSPYAEAARAQPSLLCARPELLICMATPMYRQAIPGADVICTESCRRGEACGPEYCACTCQQTLQCFHHSSLGQGRGGQGMFGATPGPSSQDNWCTAQCNSGPCPNDQCVCSLV